MQTLQATSDTCVIYKLKLLFHWIWLQIKVTTASIQEENLNNWLQPVFWNNFHMLSSSSHLETWSTEIFI